MVVHCDGSVIRLTGAVRENHWPLLSSAIAFALRERVAMVLVECSGLTHISHAGAQTFYDAVEELRGRRECVVLCGLPAEITDAIRAASCTRALPLADSVEEVRRFTALLSAPASSRTPPPLPLR